MKQTIVYLRGLNTWNSDRLVQGVFKRVNMWERHSVALSARGYNFIPIAGMGWGSINDIAKRVEVSIKGLEVWQQEKEPIHFLAHSLGGLVARTLLQKPEIAHRVSSLLTLATPHHGTPLADYVMDYPESQPFRAGMAKKVGYDLKIRQKVFSNLTPQFLETFNRENQNIESIRYGSLTFSLRPEEMSWPFRWIAGQCKELALLEGDGMVPVASQAFGEKLGTFPLDHMAQIGFVPPPYSKMGEKRKEIFSQTIDIIENFINPR